MAQVARLMKTFDKKSTDQVNPDLVATKDNDRPMSARKMLDKRAFEGKNWSNYPIPLPPQLNCNSVYAVRTDLKDANNKTLLSYYSAPEFTHKTVAATDGTEKNETTMTKSVGAEYELGILECYDGFSENDEGNFLSCDFLNPAFLKGVAKRREDEALAQAVAGATKPVSRWKKNKSCFVYAPPDTILSDNSGGTRKLMLKTTAETNWKQYAKHSTQIPGKASIGSGCNTANVLAQFWYYHEEFVDLETRDKRDPKRVVTVKEKGRIGFLFPIKPVDVDDPKDKVLNFIEKPTDSIGWGKVRHIGGELNAETKPKTWDDLQASVGQYILLTNLWSSSQVGHYEIVVETTVLERIYNTVVEMTSGNMYVNVRRGRHAYGNLCVLQKQISLNPNDECYGLPDGEKTGPTTEVWVTQIFTSVLSQTQFDIEWNRTKIENPHENFSKMQPEEINLCNIFKNTNNKILIYMKSEQYRTTMQAFWHDRPATGKPSHVVDMMKTSKDWNSCTMKAMLVTMLTTAYEIYFQKIPTKMACSERTSRFMDIFKHYKYWFINNKCLPSEAFLTKYEAQLASEAIDPASFSGMLPSEYQARAQANDTPSQLTRPTFGDTDTSDHAGSAKVGGGDDAAEVKRLKDLHEASSAEVKRLSDLVEAQAKKVQGDRLLMDLDAEQADREQRVKTFMHDKPKMEREDFKNFVDDISEDLLTPKAKEYVRLHPEPYLKASFDARWGEDPEPKDLDFATRLAKLQDW